MRGEKVIEINPGSSSETSDDADVSFLGMADVSEDGKVLTSHKRKFSEVSSGFTYFENNDVLVAKITPCFENGKGALVSNLVNGRGFGSTEFHVLRAKPQIDPAFLYLITRSHGFRANGEKHMVGSAGQKRVPTEYINSYGLLLPQKPEQIKITRVIRSWDSAIQSIEDTLAAKRERKIGLMQQLLTGKIRFTQFKNESWRAVKIDSLLDECDRYVNWSDDEAYRFASIRRRCGGLFVRGTYYGREVKTKVLKLLRAGDFVISKRQVVHGAWAMVTKPFDGFGVSDEYDVLVNRDPKVLDMRFFNYLSQTPWLRHMAYLASNGVHIEKLIFDFHDFAKEKIKIPPTVAEQAKIASVLSACDREIELLGKQLEALKEQKRGLMQKLLSGEIRVKRSKEN